MLDADQDAIDNPEDGVGEAADDPAIAKQIKIEREKKELLNNVAGCNYSHQITRVAGILNLYPDARNSDITLTIKYWETFQPEIYNPAGILPQDLFKLERLHYIVRARAKIQNEYGLFPASQAVSRFRKKNEEAMLDAVISNPAPKNVISIFSDETGKTHDFVIVASVWVLGGRATFKIADAIKKWKENSLWAKREIHFAKFGNRDMEPLLEYLNVIASNSEFLSFKVIAVQRARTRRSIEDVVAKLHEYMLVKGAEHEVAQNRITLPREVDVTLDEEQSLDAIALEEIKNNANQSIRHRYGDQLTIAEVRTIPSQKSPLIQLADVVAGAVHRKLNFPEERGHKDEMAAAIINTLNIALETEDVPGLDVSALFKI
ncbi:DUF3800 domain-containing protein [Chromobacterium vaccinii]|uniref:DUF3800 domain-containing protein n=1 Tax=Chromobacterium vaccinii TaxID=1108595 RepID=UPI000ABD192C|nr:DUF3800 domain-containing protein [Chromobacterium vaccinii]